MRNLAICMFPGLNIVDQATTYFGLQRHGVEGNPVFSYLFGAIGFGWASAIKIALGFALTSLALWLVYINRTWERPLGSVFLVLNLLYVVAAVNNLAGGFS